MFKTMSKASRLLVFAGRMNRISVICGATAIFSLAGASQAATTIDFQGLGASGNIYGGGILPGSTAGVWSNPVSGFQFMEADESVGLATADGFPGIGRVNWINSPLQMKEASGASFTMSGYTQLRNAPWTGGDYTWTVSGYDNVVGGNQLFSQTFTTTTTPTVISLSPTDSNILVKRIEWSGWIANPQGGNNGPGMITNIGVTAVSIPEPASLGLGLLGLGIIALGRTVVGRPPCPRDSSLRASSRGRGEVS